jgi:hypothetical protein
MLTVENLFKHPEPTPASFARQATFLKAGISFLAKILVCDWTKVH